MRLGIDLGTCNSSAAIALDKANVLMVESREGISLYGKRFPSYVLFDRKGEVKEIGDAAKRAQKLNPELVVWGVKRLIGLSFQEAKARNELDRFQYALDEANDGGIVIKVGSRLFRPEEILSLILGRIKEDAEDRALNPHIGGQLIDEAVISVPATFGWRTNALVAAAQHAGFKTVRTVAEPTAAALSYGLATGGKIMAFDMGGGTLDVTIMQLVRSGDMLVPGELAVSGNEALGGLDMDAALGAHWAAKFAVPDDPRVRALFQADIEMVKTGLSVSPAAQLMLPPTGKLVPVSREELEDILSPLLERCRVPITVALNNAELKAADIDHVLFVGGPTKMPCVRRLVHAELARLGARADVLDSVENGSSDMSVDPMDCVSQGAALQASGHGKPPGGVFPTGFGTIVSANRYLEIVPPNSAYPIRSAPVGISHGNPAARRVPVWLVSKAASTDQNGRPGLYEYRHLGEFGLAINPTGHPPNVLIVVSIDQNRRVQVRLQHRESGEPVDYLALDRLSGEQIFLTEDDTGEDPCQNPPQPIVPPSWTKQELEAAIHFGRALLDQLHGIPLTAQPSVAAATTDLEEQLRNAGHQNDPTLTPAIINRAQTLNAAMRDAEMIGASEFQLNKKAIDGLGQ